MVIFDHLTFKSLDPQPLDFKKNLSVLHLVLANTSQRLSANCIIARYLWLDQLPLRLYSGLTWLMLSKAMRGQPQVITWNSNLTIHSQPNRKKYPRRIAHHNLPARKNDLTRMTRCHLVPVSTKCRTHAKSGSQSTPRPPTGAKPRESSEITFLESITQASAHTTSHYSTQQVELHWAVVAHQTTLHCATEIWTQLFARLRQDLRLACSQQFRSHRKL